MDEFLRSDLNELFSLALWLFATVMCWLGAMRGLPRHLVPRVVLSIGATG